MKIRGVTFLAVLIATSLASALTAEDKPPTLTGMFPQGACRGSSVAVTVSGELTSWPLNCWICDDRERETNLVCKTMEAKGKLTITVPADAQAGVYWLRLYNKEGASSPRPFLVSELPDTIEKEPNNSAKDAPLLEKSGLLVHGRLEKKGDVDSYAVELEADEILVADLLASRTLASPMDGTLQITSAAGFVLAENDDDQEMDPRLIFRAPRKARYIVRIFSFPSKPNSSIQFSGTAAHIYRLALTTGPFIDRAYPLAAALAGPAEIRLEGWNIPAARKIVKLQAAAARGPQLLRIPGSINAVPVERDDFLSITEEDSQASGKLPVFKETMVISGMINSPGERDSYVFTSPDGKTVEVSVLARSLGSLLDPVINILDDASKTVSEKDDSEGSLDCSTRFTPAANKPYRIELGDRFSHGGPRFFYMLRIGLPARDFSLKLESASFVLEKGKKLELPVTVERHGGYDGKIVITAADLPKGVRSTTVESLNGKDSAKAVKLVLESEGAALGSPFRITGSSDLESSARKWAGFQVPGRKTRFTKPWLTVRGG
ncbi:MAG: hypothetical protein VX387_00585 [Planctomycetota bacterium]|nr:hypothetical protein [Planctomycetota bacterium]